MTGAGAAVLYGDMNLTLRPLRYVAAVGYDRADAAFSAAAVGLVQWLLATQGGEALAQAVDRVRRAEFAASPTREVRVWSDPFCLAARSVLTQAPLRDYEAARTAFNAIAAEEGWRAAALFAVVLADDRPEPHALQPVPVLRAAVESGAVVRTEPDLAALIVDAPPDAVAEWRNHRRGDFSFRCALVGSDRLAATLAAVAQRNGEPALPSLVWLLHHAADADRTSIAKALLATREDAALDPLLPYLHRSWARAALALMWAVERDVVLRDGRHGIASLAFAPGIRVDTPAPGEGTRVLDVLRLLVPGGASDRSPVPFDELDPVTASEIIREIDVLAHHGSHPTYAEADPGMSKAVALQ